MQYGLAKNLADEILMEISRSQLHAGEKLPTENVLMEKYNVSRSTVREAIKQPQAKNVVEIRRGLGSFVADNTGIGSDPLGLRFAEQGHLLEELMEVRLLLEPGIAQCAARCREEGDLRAMEAASFAMEQAARGGKDYTAHDYRFHISVAKGMHNRVIERIFPIIFEAIEKGYEQTAGLRGSLEHALWYHRGILDAVRTGDAALAGKLSKLHIEQTLQDIAERKKGDLS